jgi:hypothetical protein
MAHKNRPAEASMRSRSSPHTLDAPAKDSALVAALIQNVRRIAARSTVEAAGLNRFLEALLTTEPSRLTRLRLATKRLRPVGASTPAHDKEA